MLCALYRKGHSLDIQETTPITTLHISIDIYARDCSSSVKEKHIVTKLHNCGAHGG